MSKFTLKDLAKKILFETKRPLTAREIWDIAQKQGLDGRHGFIGKDAWNTLGRKVKNDIVDNGKTDFILIESRPIKFYLRSLGSQQDIEKVIEDEKGKVEEEEPKLKYSEEDLYPLLAYYCDSTDILPKSVKHQKSKKSHAQWLHPDMVGVYFPIKRWKKEVVDLSKKMGEFGVKLFSYEVKRSLGFFNIRESYFQAVSNSSWANEGYLVAAEIDTDEDFMSELKRLSNAFGIGIIRLDTSDPDLSEILLPAKTKDILDWETVNKLVSYNSDFYDFIVSIYENADVTKINRGSFDEIIDIDALVKIFQSIHKDKKKN
ncbi:HTH domain-containing protein [Anaerobacterium chartisolvens]|nr:HTH domain-containing protein [Anaerobacterium chartisolvens]